jgi:nicotinate-nucleotide adenylyltransferase
MAKEIAILGGSFDPVTDAHLNVASEIVHAKAADEVWIVPCAPRSDKNTVASTMERYIMCNLAVDSSFGSRFPIKVKDFELFEEEMVPTYYLLRRVQKEYPNHEFRMVIGSDLIDQVKDWHEGEKLWEEGKFLVNPRPGYDQKRDLPKNFLQLEPGGLKLAHTELSSTEIRKRLAKDVSLVDGLVPSTVLAHIIRYGLYSAKKNESLESKTV